MNHSWLLLLSLSACETIDQVEEFELRDGTHIQCLTYVQEKCGMRLSGCGLDNLITLRCQSEVTYMVIVDTD